MKIELTERQFRYLLDLVYIGNWVLNSTRDNDRIQEYDQVESLIFSHCLHHKMGKLVELCEANEIYEHPLHPYTQGLLAAIPIPDPKVKMNRIVLEGSIPSPANPPKGCKFHTRCANCMACCKEVAPVQREIEPGHFVCCHLYDK